MKIEKILILVELENGNVHQVLTTADQKDFALSVMQNEKGVLQLSERVEPVLLEPYTDNADFEYGEQRSKRH